MKRVSLSLKRGFANFIRAVALCDGSLPTSHMYESALYSLAKVHAFVLPMEMARPLSSAEAA